MVYTKEFVLSHDLTPGGILGLLQQVAGDHSALLGTDRDTLMEKGVFWAVLRHRLAYTRLPRKGETLTVKTWPMETARSAYPRATQGYDADGKLVFQGVSLWVLMDAASRAMVLPKRSGVTVNGQNLGCETEIPGSLPPIDLENALRRAVTQADLDVNGHMNNCRYLDWVADLLPAEALPKNGAEWTICYLSEALEGEELTLGWIRHADGSIRIEGVRQADFPGSAHSRIFAARLEELTELW